MMKSAVNSSLLGIVDRLKKVAPEILIMIAIIAQASLFPDYIPTTNDDLQVATLGFPEEAWFYANRPYFLISGLFSGFATGTAFDARRIYGVHVAVFYVPLAVVYLYLVSISKRHIGLFAFVVAISFQVFGYEHTTPLAYPFTTSLSLAGVAAAGLFGGRAFKEKHSIPKRFAYVFLGILSSLFYEPFALVYSILFAFSYLTNCAPASIGIRRKRMIAIFFGLLPVICIFLSRLSMKMINQIFPDALFPSSIFATYSGSQLGLGSPLLSLRVAFNHFIGATVLGHIKTAMAWPPVDRYPTAPILLTFGFTLLVAAISVTSFPVLLAEKDMPSRGITGNNGYSDQRITLLLAFSFFAAAASLVLPTALSTKYHEWLIEQGYSWGHTYLTGSLSTCFAAATASSFFSLIITNQYSRKGRKAAWSWFLGFLAVALIACMASFNHNYYISTVIRDRERVLREFAGQCRLSPDGALVWAKSSTKDEFTGLPELEEFCSTLSRDPSLYPNW